MLLVNLFYLTTNVFIFGPMKLNSCIDDYFSTPFPLTCLSARSIMSESIPYQSLDLPHHIIEFIALHDPDDIQVINIKNVDNVFLTELQFW